MSRSGYSKYCDDPLATGRWRAQVRSATRGRRGQKFLREALAAMDAMPQKLLIAHKLVDDDGNCCTIGVVCKARGIDASTIDYAASDEVGDAVGIAWQLAAEIAWENDEAWQEWGESPAQRWKRMRAWVAAQIIPDVDLTRENAQ